MRYQGGKARVAKHIVPVITRLLENQQAYYEPFCGGCNITWHVPQGKPRYASDVNPYVIAMWRAAQRGWIPERLDPITHDKMRKHPDRYHPAQVGFQLTACAFGGVWGRTLAGDGEGRDYHHQGVNALRRQISTMQDVRFACLSYEEIQPYDSVVYCDPPYAGVDQNYINRNFDNDRFWRWVKKTSNTNIMLVSEHKAPDWMNLVLEVPTYTTMRRAAKKAQPRMERLFCSRKIH